MIGEHCKLFKICSICGKLKYHAMFVSNGRDKSRRKSYCHKCKNTKKFSSLYTFDPTILKRTRISVREKVTSKRSTYQKISYENAVVMVEEGLAVVVSDKLIHQLYSNDVFKQLILERDQFLCRYCGGVGKTIDHIIPVSKGGINTFSNCVCACETCNKEKSDLSIQEFLDNRTKNSF